MARMNGDESYDPASAIKVYYSQVAERPVTQDALALTSHIRLAMR